jgi:hypothetical protein
MFGHSHRFESGDDILLDSEGKFRIACSSSKLDHIHTRRILIYLASSALLCPFPAVSLMPTLSFQWEGVVFTAKCSSGCLDAQFDEFS